MTQEGVSPAFVAAKLARPRVGRVPLRPQTAAAFELATGRRLAVICAPAGYGKTTLVAEMADRLDLDILWYKLDVLDHDPIVTIVSLTHAAQERCPGFGDVLLERVRSSAEIPFRLPEAVALFVKECTDKIDDPIHIVLDDYHEAADSNDLNWTLDYLLENLPSRFRFIVLSRYDPAFSLAKLRLADQVSLLGVDVLRFDVDQAVDVLQSRSGHLPPRAAVERLVELTEGWAASLVLASFALEWLDVDSLETALSDPRLRHDIYSYLAEQVYLREDEDTRHFLRQTCCLEHISNELGNRLAGVENAEHYLAQLSAKRAFTFASEKSGNYRYHNLFRDYLRQRVLQEKGFGAFHRLQILTIQVLEACGETELAVDLSLSINEPARVLDIIARRGEPGFENIRSETLDSWVSRLEWSAVASSPWTGLLRSQVRLRNGDFDEALSEIEEVSQEFREENDSIGLYHAYSAREYALFWKGDMAQAMDACELALAQADTPVRQAHTLISVGSAAMEMRNWGRAETAFSQADRLIRGVESPDRQRLGTLRALMKYHQGDFRTAYAEASRIPLSGAPSIGLAAALNSLGVIELAFGRYVDAQDHFRQALACSEQMGGNPLTPLILDCLGVAEAALGRVERGLSLIKEALKGASVKSDRAMYVLSLGHYGTVQRRSGYIAQSLEAYREAQVLCSNLDNPYVELNALANLRFAESWHDGVISPDLRIISGEARARKLLFAAHKATLFSAILALREDGAETGQSLLDKCIPEQLRLGHLHLIAQESHAWEPLRRILVESRWASSSLFLDSRLLEPRRRQRVNATGDSSLVDLLTARENQVLALIAEGMRNADIAVKLYVSLATVKTHVNHIFSKLGVSDRVHAVLAYKTALENKSSALDDD